MKKINKGAEPQTLTDYRTMNPDDDWKKGFKKNAGKQPNQDVREYLVKEQKGLCVYCEIDLKDGGGQALHDFRVEHFYPENPSQADKRNDGVNYALLWNNMFGCCTGGNAQSVTESELRYTNPDFSCDVNKGNHDWTGELLNPLTDIPPFPPIFDFNEDGEVSVSMNCPEGIRHKSEKTIELLGLDSERLRRFRKAIIEDLNQKLQEYDDDNLDDAMIELASTFLLEDDQGLYTSFFSTIRWYLADAAEKVLKDNNYNG